MGRAHTITFCGLLLLSTCAPYTRHTGGIRAALESGNPDLLETRIKQATGGSSKLLFYLEHGMAAHTRGEYVVSNLYFETAERIADQLFTRSLSKEAAAFLTNDEARDYRGEPFELVFINYYRALNYWYLNLPEDALVECRKANLRLAAHTSVPEAPVSYRSDAFIHYLTGLIYEATEEWNDAYVSFKHARSAYTTYEERFGLGAPEGFDADYARVDGLFKADAPGNLVGTQLADQGELVLLTEIGFVPRKTQEELNLPIYDIKHARRHRRSVAERIALRHGRIHHGAEVDYWLRVTVPRLESTPTSTAHVRVSAENRETKSAEAENLDAIARATLDDNDGKILARAVARGLAKYATTKAIKNENKWLGWLTNLFTAAMEKADTRSWVSLPGRVHISRLHLPPGTHDVRVESVDGRGRVTGHQTLEHVRISTGKRTFLNHRVYR